MRKRPVSLIVVLATFLTVAMAVPAAASTKTRVYTGETSQLEPIAFRVRKTDDGGRVANHWHVGMTITCEDGTTQEWRILGTALPLTDGVFVEVDGADEFVAIHLHGRVGHWRGRGTLEVTLAELTPDEQAQVCTTGELTWQVEYDRTLSRTPSTTWSPDLDGVMEVRVGPDGELSSTVRSLG